MLDQPAPRPAAVPAAAAPFPASRAHLWNGAAAGPVIVTDMQNMRLQVQLAPAAWPLLRRLQSGAVPSASLSARLLPGGSTSRGTLALELAAGPPGHAGAGAGGAAVPIQLHAAAPGQGWLASAAATAAQQLEVAASRAPAPAGISHVLAARLACWPDGCGGLVLEGGAVTPAPILDFKPLLAKRVAATPLAARLEAVLHSAAPPAGAPDGDGLLTMDKGRSLVPLLAGDAASYGVPLVGCWVAGAAADVRHPLVAAACLRFLCSKALADKAMVAGAAFLLLLYVPGAAAPLCYEVHITGAAGAVPLLAHRISAHWHAEQDADAAVCEAAPCPDLRLPGLPAALPHHQSLPPLALPPLSSSAMIAQRALCHTPPTAPVLGGPPEWPPSAATASFAAGEISPPCCALGPQAASQHVAEAVLAAVASPVPATGEPHPVPAADAAEGPAADCAEAAAAPGDQHCSPTASARSPPAEAAAATDPMRSSSSPLSESEPPDPTSGLAVAAASRQQQACPDAQGAGSLPGLVVWQCASESGPHPPAQPPAQPAADGPLPAAALAAASLPLLEPNLLDFLQPGTPTAWPYAATPHTALAPLLSLQSVLGLLAGGQPQLGAPVDVALLQAEMLQLRQEVALLRAQVQVLQLGGIPAAVQRAAVPSPQMQPQEQQRPPSPSPLQQAEPQQAAAVQLPDRAEAAAEVQLNECGGSCLAQTGDAGCTTEQQPAGEGSADSTVARQAWTDAESAIDRLLARLEQQQPLLEALPPTPVSPSLQPTLAGPEGQHEVTAQTPPACAHQEARLRVRQEAELLATVDEEPQLDGGAARSRRDGAAASMALMPAPQRASAAWEVIDGLDDDDDDDEADLELLRKYRIAAGGSTGLGGSSIAVRGWLYDVDD